MDASLARLGRRSELETARAQPVQEHAPSKLTGTRVSADCSSLQRKAGPARHSDGDAFFHFAGVAHLLGSCVAKESNTSESDVNPSQTSIGAAKAGRQTPPPPASWPYPTFGVARLQAYYSMARNGRQPSGGFGATLRRQLLLT